MNTVLRSLVALTAATAATPKVTGATAQSQTDANASAQAQAFNANSHPRGADGKFIATGGTVQVLGGQDGKTPIIEGEATVIVTATGPMIQVKSPTTGQITTVPPSEVQAAPVSEATLGAKGAQGIPVAPGAAARTGKADALAGTPPRSGVDALGQKANPTLLQAYLTAYQTEANKVAAAKVKSDAAKAKAAAAKAKAAANKAKAASDKAFNLQQGPAPTSTKGTRRYYR